MAWWDHEELKSHANRSDRYILAFPNEYSPEEVQRATEREAKRSAQDRANKFLEIEDRVKQAEKRLKNEQTTRKN